MRASSNALVAIVLCLVPVPALCGDLDPGPGAIAPTMKTLDQVEPRIPIGPATTPAPADQSGVYGITAPGQYYLTGNVVVPAGRSGIVVDLASDPSDDPVIIDLNGFSILGAPGSLDGVHITASFVDGRYVLRSGSVGSSSVIAGMGGNAVSAVGDAALIDGAPPVIISGIAISNCAGDGAHLENLRSAEVFGVDISDVVGNGLYAKNVVKFKAGKALADKVNIAAPGGDGVHVEDAESVSLVSLDISDAGGDGVYAKNVVKFKAGKALADTVKIAAPGGDGVHVEDADSVSLLGIDISNGSGAGISVSTPSVAGIYGVEVSNCESVVNDLQGIVVLCGVGVTTVEISDCTATGNGSGGIHASWQPGQPVYGNITVRHCEASSNAADGFRVAPSSAPGPDDHGNTITWDACTATNNTGDGFSTEAASERYTQCTAVANTGDGFFNDPIMNKAILKAYFACGADSNSGNGFTVVNHAASFRECHARGNAGNGAFLSIDPGPFDPAQWEQISCSFDNNDGHGVLVVRGDLIVRQCSFDGNGNGGAGIPGDGLSCESVGNADVQHCHFGSNSGAGMRVNDLETRLRALGLLGCVSTGNGGSGVVVEGAPGAFSGRVSMRETRASLNTGDGITLGSSAAGEVRACTLSGNGGVGLSITGAGHTVVQNTAADNALGPFAVPVPGNSLGPLLTEADVISANCQNPFANLIR